MNKTFRLGFAFVAVALLLLLVPWSGRAAGSLQIISISFPDRIPTGGVVVSGSVVFNDPDNQIDHAEFDVLDGGYDPFTLDLSQRSKIFRDVGSDGLRVFRFSIACDAHPRHVILKVSLVDRSSQSSPPALLPFFCDTPPAGNFEEEEATSRPTSHTIVLNYYFLDDGLSTITRGTRYSSTDTVSALIDPQIERALRAQIVPAMTGIWDQCGVAFRLGVVRVVRPEKLIVPGERGQSISNLFFGEANGVKAVFDAPLNSDETIDLLSVLSDFGVSFDQQLAAQGASPGRALDVFIIGRKGLLSKANPLAFGGVAQIGGTVNLIHWQSIFFTQTNSAQILLPEIVVQAMAHEIGHNLGLQHVTPQIDPLNLMISDPDLPRPYPPTVHLMPTQCDQVAAAVATLSQQTSADAQLREEGAQVNRGTAHLIGDLALGRGRVAIEGDARGDPLLIGRSRLIVEEDSGGNAVAPLGGAGDVVGDKLIDVCLAHLGADQGVVAALGQLVDSRQRLVCLRVQPVGAAVPIFRVEIVISRTGLKHLNE
jgi:hypothetical protein